MSNEYGIESIKNLSPRSPALLLPCSVAPFTLIFYLQTVSKYLYSVENKNLDLVIIDFLSSICMRKQCSQTPN